MLAMLFFARHCLILFLCRCFILGSLGFAMLALARKYSYCASCYCFLTWAVVGCPFVAPLLGPFRRFIAAVAVFHATILCWLFMIQAASFFESCFLPASFWFCFSDTSPTFDSKRPSSQALESLVAYRLEGGVRQHMPMNQPLQGLLLSL